MFLSSMSKENSDQGYSIPITCISYTYTYDLYVPNSHSDIIEEWSVVFFLNLNIPDGIADDYIAYLVSKFVVDMYNWLIVIICLKVLIFNSCLI